MAVELSLASAFLFLTILWTMNQKKNQNKLSPKNSNKVLLDTFQMPDLYDLQYSVKRAVT